MYAGVTLATAPYSGSRIDTATPPGQQIPPPVPDGTTSFTYSQLLGIAPYAAMSYGGFSSVPVWPGGGIVLVPDPERGVMVVRTWWPDAAGLLLTRITLDGTRTPVRGGYPATPAVPTRRNFCTNPGVEAGLNGYVPSDGTPTLSTVAGHVGANALRATVASAGALGVTVPHSLPVSSQATIGVDLQCSARPTAVSISVAYAAAGGGALATQTITLTADQINNSVNQWSRQIGTVTAPATAATVASIKILASGMPAGGSMDLDAVTIEQGLTTGTAFDGDELGAIWTGTRYLSVSVLAPIMVIDDAECPLDTIVTYEAYFPALVGGRVTSQQSLLPSQGRTWLTHPSRGDGPIAIDLRSVPVLAHGIEQGVFYPLNDSSGEVVYPVVVSAARRRAPTGTLGFNAASATERAVLMDLFRDGSPVLLRSPIEFNYAAGNQWVVLGELTEDRENRKAWSDAWLLSAPFYEVGAPDASLVA